MGSTWMLAICGGWTPEWVSIELSNWLDGPSTSFPNCDMLPEPWLGFEVTTVGLVLLTVGLVVLTVGLVVLTVGLVVLTVGLVVLIVGLVVVVVGLVVLTVGLVVPIVDIVVTIVVLRSVVVSKVEGGSPNTSANPAGFSKPSLSLTCCPQVTPTRSANRINLILSTVCFMFSQNLFPQGFNCICNRFFLKAV